MLNSKVADNATVVPQNRRGCYSYSLVAAASVPTPSEALECISRGLPIGSGDNVAASPDTSFVLLWGLKYSHFLGVESKMYTY